MKKTNWKIIDWKVLKTKVPYCRQHILRLEKAGLFPKRVRLGLNRIGWYEHEVDGWADALPRG